MKKISFILKPAALVAMTVILVAVSVLTLFLPSADMSRGNSLGVSEATKEYLSELPCDVSIYVVEGELHDSKFELFMKEYAKASDRISVEFVELEDSAALFAECGYSAPDELSVYTVVVKSEKRARLIDYYSMFYYYNSNFGQLSYSKYYEYYSMFSSYPDYAQYLESLVYDSEYYFNGDAILTGIVEYVSLDVIPRAYISASHGENSATEGNFAKLLLAMGYDFGVISENDLTEIPIDAGCVIINEPTSDISKSEADSLISYLSNGGRVLLVTDKEALSMQNLLSVAGYCGLSAVEGRVADTVDGAESFTLGTVLNTDHDIIAAMGNYKPNLIDANALNINGTLRPSQLVTPLVASSETSYIEGNAESKSSHILAAASEEETDGGTARFVWVTGADSFNAKLETADNLALLVYSTAWLSRTYISEVGNISASLYGENMMRVPEDALLYGGVATLILGVVPITIGAVFIHTRKKR